MLCTFSFMFYRTASHGEEHSQRCASVSFWGSEVEAHCCCTSKPNSPVSSLPLANVMLDHEMTTHLSCLPMGL